jgi:ATP-dependent DNA helicase RecG
MKPKEKEAVMAAFAGGESDVLVSTTVVEVGMDVPNAALMVVENAERFGLSQLHQLRGRVGRGIHKSYCVLISGHDGELSRERLQILCKTNDGFLISEEDLKLRGPGDFFGSRQHGLPALRIADLAGDMRGLQEAQQAAAKLLSEDGALSAPVNRELCARVKMLFQAQGEIFN